MNTLPEAGRKTLSAEEQLRMLLKKLAGHKVFGRCRGVFDEVPFERFLEAGQPSSTSAALKAFGRWASDCRIMLAMLAQFRRDGHDVAFKELRRALCVRDRVITGETVPIEQTKSGVLVIPNPEETLLLLRWIYTTSPDDAYRFVINEGAIPEDRKPCGSLTPELLRLFPDLDRQFSGYRNGQPESPLGVLGRRVDFIWEKLRSAYSRLDLLCMRVDPERASGWWRNNPTVAFFVDGKDQADVLSHFSREEQKTIATWRFDYPEVDRPRLSSYSIHGPCMWIGLHPESEHKVWKHQWPSYISRGFACGHGAVILDGEVLEKEVGRGWCPLRPYDPLRKPLPQFCGGDLTKRRLVIGFDWER